MTTTTTCEHGVAVAADHGLIFPLTPCHQASGKGDDVGVVCRSCFEEVSPLFGDCTTLDEPANARFWFAEQGCPTPNECVTRAFAALTTEGTS